MTAPKIDLVTYKKALRDMARDYRPGNHILIDQYRAAWRVMIAAGWDGQIGDEAKLPPEEMEGLPVYE